MKKPGKNLPKIWESVPAISVTAYAAREKTEAELKETGMWQVYTDIELPLVFTLDSMENAESAIKERN